MMSDNSFEESIRNLRNRSSRMEREGDYWGQEEKERLIEMFYEGVGLSEIAIRLQRTEPAVCQQIEKLDLYRRKAYPRRHKAPPKCGCLCSTCMADRSLCPLNKACTSIEEDC